MIGTKLGIDLVDNPGLLDDPANNPAIGFRASAAFWTYYKGPQHFNGPYLNDLADAVTPSTIRATNKSITRVVQGAQDLEPQRYDKYVVALNVLNAFNS